MSPGFGLSSSVDMVSLTEAGKVRGRANAELKRIESSGLSMWRCC